LGVSFHRVGYAGRGFVTDMAFASKRFVATLGVLALGVGLAVAQQQARLLESPKVVGSVMYAATGEILLVVPSLRSKEVADGLRRAATERGTTVFVIADASLVEERAGYLPGLSLLKNIQVRLLRGVRSSQAVVDRQLLLSGPLLVDVPNPLEPGRTEARSDPRAINQAASWFARAWKQAKPYRFSPNVPKPKRPVQKP
jgi:hypothetical protein